MISARRAARYRLKDLHHLPLREGASRPISVLRLSGKP